MIHFKNTSAGFFVFRIVIIVLLLAFTVVNIGPNSEAYAQTMLNLPAPGTIVHISPTMQPAVLAGLQVDPQNPLEIDFLVNQGDQPLSDKEKENQYQQLVKYFLASLTTPQQNMWVNLSPHEQNRIVADDFGQTEMGRDLLAQDYLLKQITSSLIHPENQVGKAFWKKVYERLFERYGITEVPIDTFHKVWIVPGEATVFEHESQVMITQSHMQVMLESDYLAEQHNREKVLGDVSLNANEDDLSSEIMREVVIPVLEQEINQGSHFSTLRQIHHALILATWFKQRLRDTLLGRIYMDQQKNAGLTIEDPHMNEKIYKQYIEAYRQGVYNEIREEFDPYSQTTLPRHYFSGGWGADALTLNIKEQLSGQDASMLSGHSFDQAQFVFDVADTDQAMTNVEELSDPFDNLVWGEGKDVYVEVIMYALINIVVPNKVISFDWFANNLENELVREKKHTAMVIALRKIRSDQNDSQKDLVTLLAVKLTENKSAFEENDELFWKKVMVPFYQIFNEPFLNNPETSEEIKNIYRALSKLDRLVTTHIKENTSYPQQNLKKQFSPAGKARIKEALLRRRGLSSNDTDPDGAMVTSRKQLERYQRLRILSQLEELPLSLDNNGMELNFLFSKRFVNVYFDKEGPWNIIKQFALDYHLKSYNLSLFQVEGDDEAWKLTLFDSNNNRVFGDEDERTAFWKNEFDRWLAKEMQEIRQFTLNLTPKVMEQGRGFVDIPILLLNPEGYVLEGTINSVSKNEEGDYVWLVKSHDTQEVGKIKRPDINTIIMFKDFNLNIRDFAMVDWQEKAEYIEQKSYEVRDDSGHRHIGDLDKAQTVKTTPTGGIDFDHALLNLQETGTAIEFDVPAGYEWLLEKPINGLTPRLIEITPSGGHFYTLPFFQGLISKGLIPQEMMMV